MTRTRWIIFAVICLAVLGGLIFLSNRDKVDVSGIDDKKVTNAGPLKDHVYGSTSGKATLIEYGDFECPGCGSLFPTLKPLKEHYKEQLTFVFRNFPLTSIHPNALAAATSAEAAGLQGKFFEMHDLLYANQASWKSASPTDRVTLFKQYAAELKLDVNKFEKDLSNRKVAEKIRFDQALGGKAKVTSTPTLFLNGQSIDSNTWQSSEAFEKKIREVVKNSGQELPKPYNNSIKE